MFEKVKLWLMTDENKEKYLLEKEKAEREKKRQEQNNPQAEETKKQKPVKEKKQKPVKETTAKDKKQKPIKEKPVKENKKGGGLFGKKNKETNEKEILEDSLIENNEPNSVVEEDTQTPKVKVIKKVIKKEDNDLSKLEQEKLELEKLKEENNKIDNYKNEDNSDEINPAFMENLDDYMNVDETLITVDSKTDTEELKNSSNNETNLDSKTETENSNQDSHLSVFEREQEEVKKMEKIRKKQEEKDKYMEMMLDLPPTTNTDKLIQLALKSGVPEWYLREEGYIEDEFIEEDVYLVSSNIEDNVIVVEEEVEKISLAEIKETLSDETNEEIDVDFIKESVESAIEEEILEVQNVITKLEEKVEKVEEIFNESSDIYKGTEKDDLLDDIDNKSSTEDKSKEILLNLRDRLNKLNQTREEINKEAEELKSDKNDMSYLEAKTSAENIEIPTTIEYVNDSTIDKTRKDEEENNSTNNKFSYALQNLREQIKSQETDSERMSEKFDLEMLKQKTKEAVKEAVKVVVVEESKTSDLSERLANLKRRREVINKEGNKVLVKEETISNGVKKSEYKSYNLNENDVNSVEVGNELDDNVNLEVANEGYVIDGEQYNLTTEEERDLLKKYGTREVWLLSDDSELYKTIESNLSNSRYKLRMIDTERDFLLATRSIDNVIIFTLNIPSEVKKSVAAFLKYLQQEKKRARLITSEYSKVNSKVIEYVLNKVTVEELDSYYEEFDSSLYSQNKKALVDLYREISFDLTNTIEGEIIVDTSKLDYLNGGSGDNEIILDGPVPITLEEENPLDSRSGDIEINFSDALLVDNDDKIFDRE